MSKLIRHHFLLFHFWQVLKSKSWHARAAILGYSQVMVFCNLFLMQEPATVTHIQELTISLLCDEQVEVCSLLKWYIISKSCPRGTSEYYREEH